MKQLLLKYRCMTAAFCLITMLSAFVAAGEGSQKLAEGSEQAEFEKCEELIHVRRQRMSPDICELAYSVDPNAGPRIRSSVLKFTRVWGRNSTFERQHLNGCGSYLII